MSPDELRVTMTVIGCLLLVFGGLKTIEKHKGDIGDWWNGW